MKFILHLLSICYRFSLNWYIYQKVKSAILSRQVRKRIVYALVSSFIQKEQNNFDNLLKHIYLLILNPPQIQEASF